MNADVDSGRNEVSSPGAYGCTGEEIGIPTAPPKLIFAVIKVVQLGIRTTPDKMYSRPSSFHEFPPLNIGALNVLQILLQNVIN